MLILFLTVVSKPVIISTEEDRKTVGVGGSVSLNVKAEGHSLTYRWQRMKNSERQSEEAGEPSSK